MKRTIQEFMTESPLTIGRAQTLAVAHELMRSHKVRHLPVLEGGKLVGLVSLSDLHLIETLKEVSPEKVTVDEAMSPEVFTVPPTAHIEDVAAQMAEHKYGSAVVLKDEKVVGVFTTIDALRALIEFVGEAKKKAVKKGG